MKRGILEDEENDRSDDQRNSSRFRRKRWGKLSGRRVAIGGQMDAL